jgi:hypothetical protein
MKKSFAVALAGLALAGLAASAPAQEITAREILQRMEGNYARLTSLVLTGRVLTDLDMSGGKTPAAAPKAGGVTTDPAPPGGATPFTIRLGRPGLYRIEWSQMTTNGIPRKSAVWSSGHGDFALLAGQLRTNAGGLDMALAATTNVAGYLASTLPSMFFGRQTNEVAILNNPLLLPDETAGSHNCYVISGELNGIKLMFWITKDYWLQQKRMVLGGGGKTPEITDEEIAQAREKIDQPDTPEAAARMRETMKPATAMTSKSKRIITEIYDTTELNPPLKRESFDSH